MLAASISGNAPLKVKEVVGKPMTLLHMYDDDEEPTGFAKLVMKDLEVTEVSILQKVEEPAKDEARVVCKLIVNVDMLNGAHTLHGGCSAFLVDVCSTLPIVAYALVNGGRFLSTVSQAINMTYHSPALLGDELRIVNSTMTVGSKSVVARSEIWNASRKRLVASGVHVKMEPSKAKL